MKSFPIVFQKKLPGKRGNGNLNKKLTRKKVARWQENKCSPGGGQNLQNNLLTRNIKEFNVIFLILIGTLIIGIAGATSLALFSGETSSSAKITGTVVKKQTPGTQTIMEKVGTGGLVADSHPATAQLRATTDYRYTGKNPKNYVSFNNEKWRIIGVFDVDDGTGNIEKRIKIIRDSIGNMAWSSNNVNDWANATGMKILNTGDYYNRTGSYASNGLTDEAKSQIADAKWYLGGTNSYDNGAVGLASHFYSYERGTKVYAGRPTSWIGKVGLMYPSDYGYATSGGATKNREACLANELSNWNNSSLSDCKNNDWLYNSNNYQWTLSIYSSTPASAFVVCKNGYLASYGASYSYAFRPIVFLKSDIEITGGTGTESDPYQLSL